MPVVGVTHDEHGEPIRQIPRRGVIKTGIKVGGGDKTYPKAVDYFVIEHLPEVVAKYGRDADGRPVKCRSLPVMLPHPDPDLVIDCHRTAYAATGLKCKGDGQKAERLEMKDGKAVWEPRSCPCDWAEKDGRGQAKCKVLGRLSLKLHEIDVTAVYQITTSSRAAIVRCRTAIEQHVELFGRYALIIPMTLTIQPETAFPVIEGKKSRSTVHRLSLTSALSMEEAARKIGWWTKQVPALPPPEPPPRAALPPPSHEDADMFFRDAPGRPAPLALPDTVRLPESVSRGAEELGLTPAQLQARINKHDGDLRAVGAELSAEVDRRNAGDQGRLL